MAECVAVNVQYSDAPDVIQDVEFDAAASCVDRPTKGAQQPVETGVVVVLQQVKFSLERDVLVGRLSLAGHRVVEEDGHAGETLERRM